MKLFGYPLVCLMSLLGSLKCSEVPVDTIEHDLSAKATAV